MDLGKRFEFTDVIPKGHEEDHKDNQIEHVEHNEAYCIRIVLPNKELSMQHVDGSGQAFPIDNLVRNIYYVPMIHR